jgi:phosphate transport system substrate-binding protein
MSIGRYERADKRGQPSPVVGRLVIIGCLLLAVMLAACNATVEPPQPIYLKAAGSTAMTPLVEELATAFHERQTFVTIDINGGGSTLGQQALAAGQVDLALTSWLPNGAPSGMRSTVVARDGIALIVHPTNPITGLTLLQTRDLFSGRAVDWEQIGGSSAPVQVVSREDGSGTRAAFESIVMGDDQVTLTALVMPNSGAMVDYVARDRHAIGYVSMGYVNGEVQSISVEGLSPAPENVSRGEYHLTRELVILSQPDSSPQVQAFLDFALSPAGQAIVTRRYGRVR